MNEVIINSPRTPLRIIHSVWKALFLREALTRIFSSRLSWFWLLAEPVFHLTYMVLVFQYIRVRNIDGLETATWIVIGVMAFLGFRRTSTQCMNAVSGNKAIFTYRQVWPIDTLIARAFLEGFLIVFIFIICFIVGALLDFSVIPIDPLLLMMSFIGLWLFGIGFGLILSVITELIPGIIPIINLLMMPLMLLSGVILPIESIPVRYRQYFFYNPLVHGIESARHGFSQYYHISSEINLYYLYFFALVSIFLGLLLYRRFATKLVTL